MLQTKDVERLRALGVERQYERPRGASQMLDRIKQAAGNVASAASTAVSELASNEDGAEEPQETPEKGRKKLDSCSREDLVVFVKKQAIKISNTSFILQFASARFVNNFLSGWAKLFSTV